MADLQQYQAKICNTAAGLLIHQDKVLLIKHKKLGIWFAPGGHIDENELAHKAAEREFFEETGVKVEAWDPWIKQQPKIFESELTEYVPSPVQTNLHWVSKENYDERLASDQPDQRVKTKLWPRGCEQHLGFLYLMRPLGSLEYTQNEEETDGIGWFTLDEALELETNDDIRNELRFGFGVAK